MADSTISPGSSIIFLREASLWEYSQEHNDRSAHGAKRYPATLIDHTEENIEYLILPIW